MPAIAKCKALNLIAVHSRSEDSAKSLAEKAKSLNLQAPDVYFGQSGLQELLKRSDIQTVVLCVPIPAAAEILRAAWAAGKNVISEKPIAKDVATARELIKLGEETFKSKGVSWYIAEQYPVRVASFTVSISGRKSC